MSNELKKHSNEKIDKIPSKEIFGLNKKLIKFILYCFLENAQKTHDEEKENTFEQIETKKFHNSKSFYENQQKEQIFSLKRGLTLSNNKKIYEKQENFVINPNTKKTHSTPKESNDISKKFISSSGLSLKNFESN